MKKISIILFALILTICLTGTVHAAPADLLTGYTFEGDPPGTLEDARQQANKEIEEYTGLPEYFSKTNVKHPPLKF